MTEARARQSYSFSDLQVQWPPVGILYGPVAVPTGSGRIFLVLTNVVKIPVVARTVVADPSTHANPCKSECY